MDRAMADTTAAQPDTARSPAARWLWLGLLGAPSVWLVHILALWMIAEWGCLAGWAHYTILGVQAVTLLLVIATCVALPLVIAAGLVAWRTWRRARASANDRGSENRSAYMGLGGIALSTLFGFAIILESLPALLLSPCA
jgi:hypothetical protein